MAVRAGTPEPLAAQRPWGTPARQAILAQLPHLATRARLAALQRPSIRRDSEFRWGILLRWDTSEMRDRSSTKASTEASPCAQANRADSRRRVPLTTAMRIR